MGEPTVYNQVQVLNKKSGSHVATIDTSDEGSGPGVFNGPSGLIIVDGERLYVADNLKGNDRLQVFEVKRK